MRRVVVGCVGLWGSVLGALGLEGNSQGIPGCFGFRIDPDRKITRHSISTGIVSALCTCEETADMPCLGIEADGSLHVDRVK